PRPAADVDDSAPATTKAAKRRPSKRSCLYPRQFLERLPTTGPYSGGGIRTRDLRVMSPTREGVTRPSERSMTALSTAPHALKSAVFGSTDRKTSGLGRLQNLRCLCRLSSSAPVTS